jgi:hypothetical protein
MTLTPQDAGWVLLTLQNVAIRPPEPWPPGTTWEQVARAAARSVRPLRLPAAALREARHMTVEDLVLLVIRADAPPFPGEGATAGTAPEEQGKERA